MVLIRERGRMRCPVFGRMLQGEEPLMKRITTLLLLAVGTLAACNSTAAPEVVVPVIASVEVPPASPAAPKTAATAVLAADSASSFTPAATIDEAAVTRPQDHVIGAEEPIVAIIEYGDFQ